ncbi:MAG: rhomboid family intramembrane serine protease [Motiliproteus sp.]|nr:rhomboid family intramembrane serine protease [Motiliproteus sp.]MCW9052047.1 rhomboid family intramembrane serine protease [Motiliproteus sp.]
MVKVLEIPGGENLKEFAGYLWQRKIPHRIHFNQGQQELWLADPAYADFVVDQYRRWKQGEALEQVEVVQQNGVSTGDAFAFWLLHTPITLALIGISLLLTLVTGFGEVLQWLHWFTFVDFNYQGNYLLYQSFETMISGGEWWRAVTPIFLHFSLLHLVFNLLWTWELGRRLELVYQRWLLIALVLFMGVVSNIGQFLMTGPMFGGLSGVIFGMMGYTWLWDRLCPERRFGMPPVLMTFMVIWLVLGVSGILESFGFGAIANTAHLVGLLCGLAAAPVVYQFRERLWRKL